MFKSADDIAFWIIDFIVAVLAIGLLLVSELRLLNKGFGQKD